jgi:multiple sugar transport system substrate-binding protein
MAYNTTKYPEQTKNFIKWWVENNEDLFTVGMCNSFPSRKSLWKDEFYQEIWLTKEVVEKVLPYSVSPVWPTETIYPEFAQIDGETYMAMALQAACTQKSNYEEIAKEYDKMCESAFEQ